ncbi:hypothetical protein [Candidatus Spongiihabitans sp.]|uniref:hypothetical protein n=1 Tax=Candidatus Spongiihabitans sp. TaxID=3101308 RepID=UPI003C7E6191
MASQRAFVLSIHHYPPTRHCPAHIIIGRAIQWIIVTRSVTPYSRGFAANESGYAGRHISTGFPPTARMTN